MPENRENYIGFRVYLKESVDYLAVLDAANEIQDKLADFVLEDDAPDIFTQDVTFEITFEIKRKND